MAKVRKAHVVAGLVLNVYDDEDDVIAAKLAPIAAALLDCGAEVQPGWRHDGVNFIDTSPPPPSYRVLRRLAYRDELRDEAQDDELAVIGKILDILVAQVAVAVPAGSRTPQFSALLTKIAEIKARIPAA